MGITRTLMPFESDYVQIPNAWLRDEKLSRRARGLLAELMTHRAGWHITIASLQKTGPEGRDAIRNAVIELAGRGYLIRRQTQGAGGRFNEVEYEISDPTVVGFSGTGGFTDDGATDDGLSDVGESDTKNNILQKTIDSEHQSPEVLSPSARHIEEEFDRGYAHWPKKVERKKSLQAFIRAAKSRGVERLVADVTRFGDAYAATTEKQFVPALCVWLRGERWTDELPATQPPTDAQWQSFLDNPSTSTGGRLTPTQRLMQTMAAGRTITDRERVESILNLPDVCDHRWLADGTCNFCPERRSLQIAGAA